MFVDCDGKLINLAHVSVVRLKEVSRTYQGGVRQSLIVQEFHGSDGEVLASRERVKVDGEAYGLSREVLDLSAPVIPNTTAIRAHVFYPPDPSDIEARPTAADVLVFTYPIVAWRLVEMGDPEPVLPTRESGGWVMLGLPSGEVIDPENQDFSDLSEAAAFVLKAAQSAWDRKHPAASEAVHA